MMRALLAVLVLAAVASAAPPPRFFIMGDGHLAVVNAHTDERLTVRYRREDGTYDPDALARLRRVFRSSGEAREQDVSLRLIEVLSHVQKMAGGHPLVLLSGYRSSDCNKALKDQGKQVAGGSMHTEGVAADLAFPRPQLPKLWHQVRDLDCCGAGYYAKEGFLHIDVGRPRFWEATTSRVDENLSAGNARMFARTEFDRYVGGEPIAVTLHALTVRRYELLVRRSSWATAEASATSASGATERDASKRVDRRAVHGFGSAQGWPGAPRAHDLRAAIAADTRYGGDERHRDPKPIRWGTMGQQFPSAPRGVMPILSVRGCRPTSPWFKAGSAAAGTHCKSGSTVHTGPRRSQAIFKTAAVFLTARSPSR